MAKRIRIHYPSLTHANVGGKTGRFLAVCGLWPSATSAEYDVSAEAWVFVNGRKEIVAPKRSRYANGKWYFVFDVLKASGGGGNDAVVTLLTWGFHARPAGGAAVDHPMPNLARIYPFGLPDPKVPVGPVAKAFAAGILSYPDDQFMDVGDGTGEFVAFGSFNGCTTPTVVLTAVDTATPIPSTFDFDDGTDWYKVFDASAHRSVDLSMTVTTTGAGCNGASIIFQCN